MNKLLLIISSIKISLSFIFDNFELSNNRILVKISMDISNLLITSNDFSYSYLETLDNSDNFV